MPRISDIARQRLMHMILEDVGAGLEDHQIMDKRGINARTFYRYKKLICKQCQKVLDKQSEEDISLAIFQLEQRYTKYLLSIEKKLDNTAADATITTMRLNLLLILLLPIELYNYIKWLPSLQRKSLT